MSKKANPTLIGLFVLGAIVLIVIGVSALVPVLMVGDRPTFISYFEDSVNGLEVGAPVKFQGVQVGTVVDIGVQIDPADMTSTAPVRYRVNLRQLEAINRDFVDLEDEDVLRNHIAGGLRAQLHVESIVTGLLFVNLGYEDDPDPVAPAVFAERGVIPTRPSPFVGFEAEARELTATARRVLASTADVLDEIDAEELGDALIASARAVEDLAGAPEIRAALARLPGVAAALTETMADFQVLTRRAVAVIDPLEIQVEAAAAEAVLTLELLRETIEETRAAVTTDAGIGYRVEEALISLTQAADAIRQLASSIEQDPGMLLRGRAPEDSP